MSLRDLIRPWSGTVLRHRPVGSGRSILDDEYLGVVADNRWNRAGTRTYYFAGDVGLVVAEFARHIATELPGGRSERLERSLFTVDVRLDAVLDLTRGETVAALGIAPIGDWILDPRATQATAAYLLEHLPGLQGLVVPSVAFLDQPGRINFVVYRDRVDPGAVFGEPVFVGHLVLEAAGGG